MDKLFENGIRFQCQGSGKCCQSRGTYGFVYATLDDRRRMAKLLGMNTTGFTKKYCEETDGFFHFKDPEKDCFFLDKGKCEIYEARPEQCRTWPFWPENMNAKAWNRDVVEFCPGVNKGKLYSKGEIEDLLKRDPCI